VKVLEMTDELDAVYRRKGPARQFILVGERVEAKVQKVELTLPKGDPRRDLMVNAISAYQQTAVLLKSKELGVSEEQPDALMALAGMRKVLLRKVLSGKLSKEEKDVFNVWSQSR
jgi:hypothetical protein